MKKEALQKAMDEYYSRSLNDGSRSVYWQDIFRAGFDAGYRAASSPRIEEPELCWECNECGAQEYTMALSENDVHALNCGCCGGDEWHKAVSR